MRHACGMRWQYRVVNIADGNDVGRALSYFGQRGWELVHAEALGAVLIFKRPVPPGAEPEGPWAEMWGASDVTAAYAGA